MQSFRKPIIVRSKVCESVYKWLLSIGDPGRIVADIVSKMYWKGSVGGVNEEQVLSLAERIRNANK